LLLRKTILAFLVICMLAVPLGCTPASSSMGSPEPEIPKPQDVVEKFLGAINSGNYEEAWNLQSENLKEQATLEEFKNSLEQYKKYFSVSKQTWEITESIIEGDTARVRFNLITYFQNGTAAQRESEYLLKLEGGSWKIDRLLETP